MSTSLPTIHDPADRIADETSALPEHLIQLPGSEWALWRTVALRAAGFPIENLRALVMPECAAAAERVLAAEDAAAQAGNEVVGALVAALDARASASMRDEPDAAEDVIQQTRRIRQRAIRNLRQGRLPDPDVVALLEPALVQAFETALARLDAARDACRQVFVAASAQLSQRLRDIAADDRFREAITWQNRQVLHTGINVLHQQPSDGTLSKQRKKEPLIASYLQRYCAKNETIGFFGPVGWAHFVAHGASMIVQPGQQLLAARTVYFEGWCIDALAEALNRNEALRPWMVPRRMPFIHLDGTTLHLPLAPPVKLSAQQAAVLRACDGDRTAKQIAADLIQNPSSGLTSELEVYAALKNLHATRRIEWKLEVSAEGTHPEQRLRQLCERIEDDQLRRSTLAAIDELMSAREHVARAAGDAQKLDHALADLEATFTRLTGVQPTRYAGETYGARTLVYEDCRRDIEVALGPEILQSLGPPLALLLTSARWFTSTIAATYLKTFQEIYSKLAQKSGSPIVDFASFWLWAQSLVLNERSHAGERSQLVESVLSTFQERWASILAIPPEQRCVRYSSTELEGQVRAAFEASEPAWWSACYHSPDIMIAAPSVEAIQRGDYDLVLGELHLGINTLGASAFVAQHPSPERLFQALEIDLPEPCVVPVLVKQLHAPTSRTLQTLLSPKDFRLIFAHDTCGVHPSRALPTGALVVEECGGDLVVRTRDGQLRFDITEVFAQFLTFQVSSSFKIMRPSEHTPRVTCDRLIVCRESWRVSPAEIAFAYDKLPAERFVATRRWAATYGMPRYVFVKSPIEKKPIYVDFDSPISVDLLAKLIRGTVESGPADAWMSVTEMLPDPDQTWLPDALGQRYTNEFRVVAFDRAGAAQRRRRGELGR